MGLFSTVPGCTWLYLTVPGCPWLYLALPWSAMIYLSTDCHVLPLTGLNAFVYTGLNAQKLKVDGWAADLRETQFWSSANNNINNNNNKSKNIQSKWSPSSPTSDSSSPPEGWMFKANSDKWLLQFLGLRSDTWKHVFFCKKLPIFGKKNGTLISKFGSFCEIFLGHRQNEKFPRNS